MLGPNWGSNGRALHLCKDLHLGLFFFLFFVGFFLANASLPIDTEKLRNLLCQKIMTWFRSAR